MTFLSAIAPVITMTLPEQTSQKAVCCVAGARASTDIPFRRKSLAGQGFRDLPGGRRRGDAVIGRSAFTC